MAAAIVEQAYRSDTGRQRNANEDSYFARAPLFAVADGMGGAQAGEVASRLAAESFEPAERGEESPEAYLRAIAEDANARIHRLAQTDASRSGMGTTLTAALVEGDEVSFAHVGDSRAYLLRDGELKLLTSDHSLVEELRRQGRLTDEQAEDHPQRSIITRALGPEREVEVDTMTYQARPGDVYLLCSDGLTTMLREDRIAAALTGSATPRRRGRQPGARGQRGGRPGQHHGGRLPARGRRGRRWPSDGARPWSGPAAEEAGPDRGARGRGRRLRSGTALGGAAAPRATRRSPAAANRGRVVAASRRWSPSGWSALAVWGVRQIYFLGSDSGGRLALYRGLPTTCRSASSSTRRSTRRRSRSARCPPTARTAPPTTRCASTTTPSRCSRTSSGRPSEPPSGKQQAAAKRRSQARQPAAEGARTGRRREAEGSRAPAAPRAAAQVGEAATGPAQGSGAEAAGSERAKPRAPGADPGRAARHRGLHGGLHRRVEPDRRPQPDLRRLLPRRLPRRPHLHPRPPARTRTRTCSRSARCWPRSAW